MANLYKHPAPGFGELIPGWFKEPENPIRLAAQAKPRGIADLTPAAFNIPQNPILAATLAGCGCGSCASAGMGCGSGCGGCGGCGMGALDLTSLIPASLSDIANTDVFGFPLYAVAGAGVLAMMLMGGRGKAYREDKDRIRKKHPTTAGRLRRAASAF